MIDFVAALSKTMGSARTNQSLKAKLADLARDQGFDCFAYLRIGSPKVEATSNYPRDWQALYLRHAFSKIDPVVEKATRCMRPFLWSGAHRQRFRDRTERDFFGQAAEFGIRSGLSLPIPTGLGGLAILTFASNRAELKFGTKIDPICAAAAVGIMHGILQQEREESLPSTVDLKHEERLCLAWYSKGKTYRDIADIEGMKFSNVCFHMANIRRKFGVGSTAQALMLAVRMQLLTLSIHR